MTTEKHMSHRLLTLHPKALCYSLSVSQQSTHANTVACMCVICDWPVSLNELHVLGEQDSLLVNHLVSQKKTNSRDILVNDDRNEQWMGCKWEDR